MKTFVTGGTGFVGGAVVRCLVAQGHSVCALVRRGSNARQLEGLPVERVEGGLDDGVSLRRGMDRCDWVFHVAALYSYWGHAWEEFYQVNVQGTHRVMQACAEANVHRVVYTSSIATLGMTPDRSPADEETPSTLADMIGHYKRSKYMAEDVAREYARKGLPVVVVNPAAPVGVGDHKPTPTGQMILDFLHGRMFGFVDTGLTIVDVEDVAVGHVLAAERGRIGERYILGGENLTLKQVLDLLSDISGRPSVRLKMPHSVALAWSHVDVSLARLSPTHRPAATPETARLSRRYEFYDSSKAVRELGFPQTSAREALRKAVEWYRSHGYAP